MKICSIEGCQLPSKQRGWCAKHYARWYRHRDPMKTIHNMSEVTWEYVQKNCKTDETTGCMEWQKSICSGGYGMTQLNGKQERTHRVSYILNFGEIPNGLHVLHKCDNRKCVNPEHLFLGTQKDNNKDRTNKGRTARGNKHYLSKFKESDIRKIRKSSKTNADLAKDYGVCKETIYSIRKRKNWAHVR